MIKSAAHKNRGLALFFVLGTILLVTVLANAILAIMSSQSRLTHHQVTRIQSYYAAQGAMNLAFEQLRMGAWGTGTYRLCTSGCSAPDINDADMPYDVTVDISDVGAALNHPDVREVRFTSNYTYTP